VKIRYGKSSAKATVFFENDNEIKVVFDEPVWAVTPGQSVVFYDENEVIGGATIL
jgi:tRNA-specific 2-thiouridylase